MVPILDTIEAQKTQEAMARQVKYSMLNKICDILYELSIVWSYEWSEITRLNC